jgi:hypothetical protein
VREGETLLNKNELEISIEMENQKGWEKDYFSQESSWHAHTFT